MLRDFLQGKPFHHPLHTALVHFPIGLFALSLLLDGATLLLEPANALVQGAFYTMAGGIGLALLAAIPGLVDWAAIRADHPGKKIATTHMLLNLAAVGLYALNLSLRAGTLDSATSPGWPFALSLIGIGILSVSGYLGGRLVYEDGIAVGRHRRRTDTPRETIYVSAAGLGHARDGLAPVAEADGLGEGETLRVELDGEMMTIVRLNGEFYAFQEFCTHRYGPLSEGSFQDGQVRCPWHRSCFDVRTGKVTQGPAKEELKTYAVVVKEGIIHIRAPTSPSPQAGKRRQKAAGSTRDKRAEKKRESAHR
jgi:nitrite reductase/ring-hydroxylating ferredoxin subunit/uncharacterized membrane protein